MKKAIIVHCWGGNSNYCWYPWLKNKLESDGFMVLVPDMPNTDEPILEEWLNKLGEVAGKPDRDTVFIGHSLGNITILKYLESIPLDAQNAGCVFVAGFA